MAVVPRKAMNVSYGFRDQEGTETAMQVHMTNPLFALVEFAGFVEYLTFAKVDLANAVAALSDSPQTRIGITIRETEPAQGAFGTGEAEKKGVFRFLDIHGAPLFAMAIPGIKETVLQANGRDINLANAAVVDFIAGMTSGGVAHPITANQYHVVSVIEAYKQHRASSGGSKRHTG